MEAPHMVRLLEAVNAEAARIAEAPVTLVSITFDWMTPADGDTTPSVEITRSTRTLVFTSARLTSGERLVCTATAVHRIEP